MFSLDQRIPLSSSLFGYLGGLAAGFAIAWIAWGKIVPFVPPLINFIADESIKILLLALVAFAAFVGSSAWEVFLVAVASGIWVSTVPRV